jgi:hypothetical protein
MTLAKVVRKGCYQGVPQWGISTSAEITPSKTTAKKWATLENTQRIGPFETRQQALEDAQSNNE